MISSNNHDYWINSQSDSWSKSIAIDYKSTLNHFRSIPNQSESIYTHIHIIFMLRIKMQTLDGSKILEFDTWNVDPWWFQNSGIWYIKCRPLMVPEFWNAKSNATDAKSDVTDAKSGVTDKLLECSTCSGTQPLFAELIPQYIRSSLLPPSPSPPTSSANFTTTTNSTFYHQTLPTKPNKPGKAYALTLPPHLFNIWFW